IGEDAAHWMAVLGMDQYAHALAARLPEAALVDGDGGISAAIQAGRLPVLAPYHWLRAADPLPHSWEVTSDTIAAWLAGQLGARRVVLIKPAHALDSKRSSTRISYARSRTAWNTSSSRRTISANSTSRCGRTPRPIGTRREGAASARARRAATRARETRPVRPPTHAAPRTPTTSAPRERASARSGPERPPASAANTP